MVLIYGRGGGPNAWFDFTGHGLSLQAGVGVMVATP